jgi:hypothetical protein
VSRRINSKVLCLNCKIIPYLGAIKAHLKIHLLKQLMLNLSVFEQLLAIKHKHFFIISVKMGSSHRQEDSWMDEEFSKLAMKIEEMGKEMENLKDHYGVEDRFNEVIKECADTKGLVERNGFGNKNKSDPNEVKYKNGFSQQSDGLNDANPEKNILEKGLNGNFNPNEVFESDSDNSLNITNETSVGNEVRKERLVLKLKRLSRKYFMVDKLPIKDKNVQKQFVNYEAERYAFQVYVDDLPKVYRCKLCPKIYNKITSLVFHKRTHTKLPPGYNAGDFARRFSNHAAPIEPYMPAIHNKLTENLVPHPRDYPGYLTLEKSLPVLRTGSTVIFNGDTFFVGDFIGEGGFAKVTIGLVSPTSASITQFESNIL